MQGNLKSELETNQIEKDFFEIFNIPVITKCSGECIAGSMMSPCWKCSKGETFYPIITAEDIFNLLYILVLNDSKITFDPIEDKRMLKNQILERCILIAQDRNKLKEYKEIQKIFIKEKEE